MESGIVMESIFLTKAKRNLQAAQLLFDHQMFDEAVNRTYYAAFQAALAKLSDAKIPVDRMSHKAVQANFNAAFIHKQELYPNHLNPLKVKSLLLKQKKSESGLNE